MRISHFHPRSRNLIGFIPDFLSEDDPRPAKDQFNENYAHGGGWQPFGADKWQVDLEAGTITYPEDPPYHAVAEITFRDERIFIFPHAWVMIVQPDNSWEIARMD